MQTKEFIIVVIVILGLSLGISVALLTGEMWLLPLGMLVGMIVGLVVQNLMGR